MDANKIREIRTLWKTGMYKQRELAEMYGKSVSFISNVVNRIIYVDIV